MDIYLLSLVRNDKMPRNIPGQGTYLEQTRMREGHEVPRSEVDTEQRGKSHRVKGDGHEVAPEESFAIRKVAPSA